jgi:hypothetical protein
VLRCRPASSWSCSSAGWVCSCIPATTLDSRDESLTHPLRNKAPNRLRSCRRYSTANEKQRMDDHGLLTSRHSGRYQPGVPSRTRPIISCSPS